MCCAIPRIDDSHSRNSVYETYPFVGL